MQRFFVGPTTVHKRSRLPHWDCDQGICAVTFNLFDAVPRDRLARLRAEAEAQRVRLRQLHGQTNIRENTAIAQWTRRRLIQLLDDGSGSAFMGDRDIAAIVAGVVMADDGVSCELFAWCVMPNHVHVVFAPAGRRTVAQIVGRWKGASARKANLILCREGQPFWQEDYFDRTVRGPAELRRWIDYVAGNPAKSGLVAWPWVRVYAERLAEFLT